MSAAVSNPKLDVLSRLLNREGTLHTFAPGPLEENSCSRPELV
jgi:hypothetical protein